jgi:hypothetical protein
LTRIAAVRGTTTLGHAGSTHDLSAITNSDTSLCLKISPSLLCELPASACTIITVENPTAFVELEQMLMHPWQLAIYTAGKMSNILLLQLQQWHQQQHQRIHFGDYDYVGLLEFARILVDCPTARLYYPDSLPEQLQKYGNTELLQAQIEQHKALLKEVKRLPDSRGKKSFSRFINYYRHQRKGWSRKVFIRKHSCRIAIIPNHISLFGTASLLLHVHCAFSPISALSCTRLRLFNSRLV